MGMMSRFADIMKSNINAALDKAEDPAKMIDQTLRDAREDLAKVRKETAGVMAVAKDAEREYDECLRHIEEYTEAAKNALKAGNEGDARVLLGQKNMYEKNLESLKEARDVAVANADKMRELHDKLTIDIKALEAKRSAIRAKVTAAKAQGHINDVVAGGDRAKASLDKFEKMEDKADKMLDAAMAEADLGNTASDDLLEKYSGNSTSVEDELDALKKELGV